tara:strand:- start:1526 stop:2125 length:600 start_codon:yes stop_codon:yes gene_type:complete
MGLISNGTTIFDSGAMAAGLSSNMIKIRKQTASASATLSFTSGIDSTYKEYLFTWKDIHPSNDGVAFSFQGSTDTGSSYGVTMTTSFFNAYHDEADSATSLGYRTGEDIAQGTGYQGFQVNYGADNDQSGCGFLQLFNPSSTTFVKHFISRSSNVHDGDYAMDNFLGGYFNTTSAIDAIQFKMSLGNIDAGDICLYGIL